MVNPQKLVTERPTFERMLDWLEGRLSTEDAATVAAQIDTASQTTVDGKSLQADADWIRAFLRVRSEIVLEAPPPQVRTRLTQEFAAYASQRSARHEQDESQPSLFARIVATLTFDSGLQPMLSGARAAQTSAARQLIYTTPAAQIAVNVQPSARHMDFSLSGQILPTGDVQPNGFSIQLLQRLDDHNADSKGTTTADEFGEFAFDRVAPGEYRLVLTADPLAILIDSVTIQAPMLPS